MKVAMTVAGSDSGGGAGIQADLKTFAALKVYGASAITALTAQNTQGVEGVYQVPPSFVAEQMEAVLKDMTVQVLKTGMLSNQAVIEEVAGVYRRWGLSCLVLDPVMVAKSGDMLLEKSAVNTLREKLFPLAIVITPNLNEAGVLIEEKVDTMDKMKDAARKLHRMGPTYVVVKGGHLLDEGEDINRKVNDKHTEKKEVVDLIYDGNEFVFSRIPWVDTFNTHGTGCTYAAAAAAYLARGREIISALRGAHHYVQRALIYSQNPGKGAGPLHHMHPFYEEWK